HTLRPQVELRADARERVAEDALGDGEDLRLRTPQPCQEEVDAEDGLHHPLDVGDVLAVRGEDEGWDVVGEHVAFLAPDVLPLERAATVLGAITVEPGDAPLV